jgi:hypothetical protein
LRKIPQRFTRNKAVVRGLQRQTIAEHFPAERLGSLRYFGLPSSSLGDVMQWRDLFAEFVAVERGEAGNEWELQHDLALEAYRTGLLEKIALLRGDIDSMLRTGRDSLRRKLKFPFDVVSLDYSGGLFYRDSKGELGRLKAISALFVRQAASKRGFVLLISCNLDRIDQAEVRQTLAHLKTELSRYGQEGNDVIEAYLKADREECRLKLYVPFFVNKEAAKNHFNCETARVIIYEGNRRVRMMAFRFRLIFDEATESLREPRERWSQTINQPFLEIREGECQETTLGLPKLRPPIQRSGQESQPGPLS